MQSRLRKKMRSQTTTENSTMTVGITQESNGWLCTVLFCFWSIGSVGYMGLSDVINILINILKIYRFLFICPIKNACVDL